MSQINSIPTWVSGNRELLDIISQIKSFPENLTLLRQQLYLNRQKFVDILDTQPKNGTHRIDLNSSNQDFVEKALFLSDQLDVNEHVAAALLMQGTIQAKNANCQSVDTAVLLFHAERGYLLASLEAVIRLANDATISEQARSVCYQFMAGIMSEKLPLQNEQTGTFVAKVIEALKKITQEIHALQNTGSLIGQMPNPGSGKLGDDISSIRMERLSDERIVLVQILYHTASLFSLDISDKLNMLKILEKAKFVDPATLYMILAMIAAISNEQEPFSQSSRECDAMFHRRIMTNGADEPVIKAVVVLQWVLYLTNPTRADMLLKGPGSISDDTEIQQLVEGAINADVFGFLDQYMLHFQHSFTPENMEESKKNMQKDRGYKQYNVETCNEFQQYVVYELKLLSQSVIRQLFGVLQGLKYKEEDFTSINTLEPMNDVDLPTQVSEARKPCRDLEYFLKFLATVFAGTEESGLIFWQRDGGLNHFVRWVLDIKVQSTVCAAFDFFASISTGVNCANSMFDLFKRNLDTDMGSSLLFTWRRPLSALEYYANLLQNNGDEAPCHIPVDEELLLCRFLNILKLTVQYCAEARHAFWQRNEENCRIILQQIIKSPTTPDLRAAVFNVISAFCSSWGGGINNLGKEISIGWWHDILASDLFVTQRKTMTGDKKKTSNQPSSLLQEIQIEQKRQVYTETLAIVNLIGTAIHFPSKRQNLHTGFKDSPFYIPIGTYTNGDLAGVSPSISLVMDTIFTGLGSDKSDYTKAQWDVTEACLTVMENSIGSFIDTVEKTNLKAGINGTQQSVEVALVGYLMHPGFQIVVRILSGGRIVNELFNIIRHCSKNNSNTSTLPHLRKCLIKTLRILLNVLELQPTLSNILIPCIAENSKQRTTSEFRLANISFPPVPSIAHLGQFMLVHSSILVQISLLVNYQETEEVCLLSTKILQHLSVDLQDCEQPEGRHIASLALYNLTSKGGATTTSVLYTSSFAEEIVFGMSERLKISVPERLTCDDYEFDINLIPFWEAENTLGNAYDYPNYVETPIISSVRLAILDLLLANSRLDTNAPTLAEYLLGYKIANDKLPTLQNTDSNGASLSCLHEILSLLQQGTQSIVTEDSMVTDSLKLPLLIDTHPILAEKCYEIVYRLCAKRSISVSTLRYLRNEEDYFTRQFKAMSIRFESGLYMNSSPFSGTIFCADGNRIESDFFRVRAKLHQRAWLLQSIALELHTAACMEQTANIRKLLELLYGRPTEDANDSGYFANGYQQPLAKMLEFVSSLDFVWEDDLTRDGGIDHIKYFESFVPKSFYMLNKDGVEVYDIRAIYKYLRMVETDEYLESENAPLVQEEMGRILASCMALNRTKEINHAKRHCMKAWKQVVHITLLECFDLIDVQNREKIIYELLSMLLARMLSTKAYDAEMSKNMSEMVLALLSRLKKEKKAQKMEQLPVEMLRHIFNSILQCICQQSVDVVVRGDLYTSLTSLLLYFSSHEQDIVYKELEQYMIQYITSYKPELLDFLCEDAMNGLDIWKTTAYIALDALNAMALRVGSDIVQSRLLEKNCLQFMIETIQYDDTALTVLLESMEAPLLSLYIFEAKMSILLRLGMNPEGAKYLFNNRIFEVLGQCQFMRIDVSKITSDLLERYERLVNPTLKLITAIISVYGSDNNKLLRKAQLWTRKQEIGLSNILKTEEQRGAMKEAVKLVRAIQQLILWFRMSDGEKRPVSEEQKEEQKVEEHKAEEAETKDDDDKPKTVFDDAKNYNMKHPLQNTWTLWFDNPGKKANATNWSENLKEIVNVNTVEDFWGVYNNIPKVSILEQNSNYHVFKQGVRPEWEDPYNANGGKFSVQLPRNRTGEAINDYWLNLMLAMFGEQFKYEDEICGAVVSVRKVFYRVSLWTKTSERNERIETTGRQLKEFLNLGNTSSVDFTPHGDSANKSSENRFTV
ncbi:nucleoporin Nup186/Nup192/Nup205 [Sporodiniella umbellata]|nr:nucleoporin Nup186/Nup192/Nup205 [Sporodiniella umbellata]